MVDRKTEWHLDRRVTVSLIFAILAQTFGIAWWAATIESRVTVVERGMAQIARNIDQSASFHMEQISKNRDNVAALTAAMAGVTARLDAIMDITREIRTRLDGRENTIR